MKLKTLSRRQVLAGVAVAATGAAAIAAPVSARSASHVPAVNIETVRLAHRWREAYRQAKAAALVTERSAVHPLADEPDGPIRAVLAAGREYAATRRAMLAAKPCGIEGAAAMLTCAADVFNDRKKACAGADDIPGMVFEWQGEREMVDLAMEALHEVARLP